MVAAFQDRSGLTHTQVRDRKRARAARIMAALFRHAPDLWTDNGQPVIEAKATGRILKAAA
jgi:hypothetical protein